MKTQFHISPKWNIEEFYGLNYFLTTHKDEFVLDEYQKSGHDKKYMTLYNYHEPSPMPKCINDYVKSKFNFLKKIAIGINYFKPGQYLPIHVDIYGKYMQVYETKFENIVRYVIMLEDNVPGQILQIEENLFGKWKSGDCFGWKCDEKHAFYNFSMKDRYAIQVTGVLE